MKARVFTDRIDAGRQLADALRLYGVDRPIVATIPKGGAIVGVEVSRRLKAPIDAIVVGKVESSISPESRLGVMSEGGIEIIERDTVRMMGVEQRGLRSLIEAHRGPLARRTRRFGVPRVDYRGRPVIVVDEGLSTGLTMLAAIRVARQRGASGIIVAVPVASARAIDALKPHVDDIVCLMVPKSFSSVGQWYRDFEPISEREALTALQAHPPSPTSPRWLAS